MDLTRWNDEHSTGVGVFLPRALEGGKALMEIGISFDRMNRRLSVAASKDLGPVSIPGLSSGTRKCELHATAATPDELRDFAKALLELAQVAEIELGPAAL